MTGATALDPVCGMTIDPAEAAGQADYRGQTYYFCHPSCLERFQAAPGDFVADDGGAKPPAPAAVPGARSYICPMDPEIRQATPGACPKCGMALEADLSDPAALSRASVRSAAWRSSRASSRSTRPRTPSSPT
jgi:Cu+-exporting ATPase